MFLEEIRKAGAPPEGAPESSDDGPRMPEIMHLFAYRPEKTDHLSRFTQEVMRGPSELSPGQRELIAAFTSDRNGCPF